MRPPIFVLEDDEDLREMLVTVLESELGRPALSAGSVAAMMEHKDGLLECSMAILDMNLGAGQPNGLDAYRWLRQEKFAGRIAFLTGHAHTYLRSVAPDELEGVEVFAKPISIEQLRSLVGGNRSGT